MEKRTISVFPILVARPTLPAHAVSVTVDAALDVYHAMGADRFADRHRRARAHRGRRAWPLFAGRRADGRLRQVLPGRSRPDADAASRSPTCTGRCHGGRRVHRGRGHGDRAPGAVVGGDRGLGGRVRRRADPVRFCGPAARARSRWRRRARWSRDHGVRGFKFHPSLQGFAPNDQAFYPLWAEIESLGVPALFHTGQTGIGAGPAGRPRHQAAAVGPDAASTTWRRTSPG